MTSSQFKKSQLKNLGAIVNLSPERLIYIIENIHDFYKERTEKKYDSKGNAKTYIDGTEKLRTIRPSYKDLKLAQHRIKSRILKPIKLPDNIHGGVNGKSNITNAKAHQGNKYIFVTDLQDFYPSITSKMVYDSFLAQGYSNHMAGFLCKLTTWKHCLPQGTPTSTHISNLVFLNTDNFLIEFCKKHEITYTRYIDDLTFSCQQNFQDKITEILSIVTAGGFKLSFRKTQYGGKEKNGKKYVPMVTGIYIYPNKIDAHDKIIERAALEIDIPIRPVTNYLNNIRKTNIKIYR